MRTVDYESKLSDALADSAISIVTSNSEVGQLILIESVPPRKCVSFVENLRQRLKSSGRHQPQSNAPGLEIEIYVFSSGKPLHELSPLEVNEERATRVRNSGKSILLVAPPGPSFPSIGSAFENVSYRELLRRASRLMQRGSEPREPGLFQTLGISEWLDGPRVVIDNSEGWAYLVSMISYGASRTAIGAELWRIGLIPDIGTESTVGDFTVRLQRNHQIVKFLGGIVQGKKLVDRLSSAHVGLTPTTRKVLAVLETKVLANPAGESGWCRDLCNDELTLDKWDLEPDTGDLESIQILPFRDLTGKVRSVTRLNQDDPKTFAEALFAKIDYLESGEVRRSPSVVVEWETKPTRASTVGKWRVSLVVPRAYRREDQDPILVKTVKASARKQSLRLDLSAEDLPDGVFGSSLLVAIEVAAISEDDEMVMRLMSGDEALDESEEFELRFDKAQEGDESAEPLNDDSMSPAMAILDVSVTEAEAPFRHVSVLRPEKSVLELQFLDSDSEKAAVRLIRSIRVIPKLVEIQGRILKAEMNLTHVSLNLDPSDSLSYLEANLRSEILPEEFWQARRAFFAEVRSFSKTPNSPLVETLEWEPQVSKALDAYVGEYQKALENCPPQQLDELLKLDTVSISIARSVRPLTTTVVLPTHPLRSLWLRDYWVRLTGWTQAALAFDSAERPNLIDIDLAERITPGNLPFVVKGATQHLQIYASELSFGYGIYVGPDESDHEALVSATIEVLGSASSRAIQASRLSAIKRNVDDYVSQRRHPEAIAVATLNAGDGELVSSLFGAYFAEETDAHSSRSDFRLEVTTYSEEHWRRRPAENLAALQTKFSDVSRDGLSHLSPLIRLAVKPRSELTTDNHSVNLAIIQGIATGEVDAVEFHTERVSHLEGLLTGTETIRKLSERQWHVVPTCLGQGSSRLSTLHRVYLSALRKLQSDQDLNICLTITLTPECSADIRALHDRADRVITLDRFVGLDWFIKSKALGLGSSYILDYTPDFVEGLADRMIVTTQHPAEADRVIENAMMEMGLMAAGRRSQVIDNLNLVSGRLVLRLMSLNPQAHETVGLAVVTAVLRNEGDLGRWFVIPIDSHLEIFGGHVLADNQSGRRCDMLLVALDDDAVRVRCLEVKERRSLPISDQLRHRIREQLRATESILRNRYFHDSRERIDRDLQLAHLSAILHHYISRASDHGLLSEELARKYHRLSDLLKDLKCEIRKEAYVVSIESPPRPTETLDDFAIRYLTSEDLDLTAFSSTDDAVRRTINGAEQNSSSKYSEPKAGIEGFNSESRLTRSSDQGVTVFDTQDLEASEQKSPEQSLPNNQTSISGTHASMGEAVPTSAEDIAEGDSSAAERNREGKRQITVELGTDVAGQAVSWEISTKGSPHAFVLGITGQGKSVTTRHVISTFSEQGLPSLVIDVHGDMAANPPVGASVLDVRSDGLGFSPFYLNSHTAADISENAFEIAEIFAYVCELGEMQLANVFKAIKEVYIATGWINGEKGERLPKIEEFAEAVERVEKGARGRNARERLLPLTDFGLFLPSSMPFEPRGTGGGGLVVDLHRFKLEQVIRAATALILRKVYREMFLWPQDSTLKLAIVLDEAHRIAKDPTLPKLLKEGRKYGVACFVASQSISDFDDDVKNNSGTKIVFRTNFPESKDVAGLIRGGEKVDFAKQIEQLRVGEAFVSTAEMSRARKCRMRSGSS